jgi:TRAP-type C4-dicarboxylate transport system permease small subunit
MKTAKWLDEHFEEAIIIFLLAVISVVELMQVVCRNVPGIPALSWAEEMARYAWIVTVFISLPFTIRTNTTLKVTALVEAFPWKVTNIITIIVDLITAVALGILAWTSTTVIGQVLEGGSTSPAMQIPMWIMYVIIFIGFAFILFVHIELCTNSTASSYHSAYGNRNCKVFRAEHRADYIGGIYDSRHFVFRLLDRPEDRIGVT